MWIQRQETQVETWEGNNKKPNLNIFWWYMYRASTQS